ncbi:hypothetical protein C8R46DRAFT_1210728 [Mycena filopes]|nr:hypothetical protein C8R46DRAFT_1210728 [Mycena filopes]
MERVREARTLWRTAVRQVEENIKKTTTSDVAAKRAETALQALDRLPWDGMVEGFKAGCPVEDLAGWFTTEWLRSDHEDQMLELLALDPGLDDGSTTSIPNSFFVTYLARAYSDPEAYRTARSFGWLRRIGTSFATKQRTRLGTIANKSENHWVALGIDSKKDVVGYGDGS